MLGEVAGYLQAEDTTASLRARSEHGTEHSPLTAAVGALAGEWWNLDHAMTPRCPDPSVHLKEEMGMPERQPGAGPHPG